MIAKNACILTVFQPHMPKKPDLGKGPNRDGQRREREACGRRSNEVWLKRIGIDEVGRHTWRRGQSRRCVWVVAHDGFCIQRTNPLDKMRGWKMPRNANEQRSRDDNEQSGQNTAQALLYSL